MIQQDLRGSRLSGANHKSLTTYETGLRQFSIYTGDPLASADAALAESPEFVMAHVLRAYLHLMGTEPAGLPIAEASLNAADHLPASRQEKGHLTAIRHLTHGRWQAASQVLEDIAIENPNDLLALQAGHLVDFFRGDARMLRDRIARVLPQWLPATPGYHAMLGMHAFGLEEMGQYSEAEASGRRAVECEPCDIWAQHAVAHVCDMQGRHRDGIAWMEDNAARWPDDCFFAIHNWWHLALYYLDLGIIDKVLALYDGPIYGTRSRIVLDMVDATAMLWRLHLRGIDVGNRWTAIADAWEPLADAGNYAFNDMHATMAFVGAGRPQAIIRVLETQKLAMTEAGDNAMFTRDVGDPATRAIQAFGEGHYAETVSLLRGVRNIASRFGGSHAQRDVLDLTLIEAALRSGQQALARALAAERAAVKPASPLARLFLTRAATLSLAA